MYIRRRTKSTSRRWAISSLRSVNTLTHTHIHVRTQTERDQDKLAKISHLRFAQRRLRRCERQLVCAWEQFVGVLSLVLVKLGLLLLAVPLPEEQNVIIRSLHLSLVPPSVRLHRQTIAHVYTQSTQSHMFTHNRTCLHTIANVYTCLHMCTHNYTCLRTHWYMHQGVCLCLTYAQESLSMSLFHVYTHMFIPCVHRHNVILMLTTPLLWVLCHLTGFSQLVWSAFKSPPSLLIQSALCIAYVYWMHTHTISYCCRPHLHSGRFACIWIHFSIQTPWHIVYKYAQGHTLCIRALPCRISTHTIPTCLSLSCLSLSCLSLTHTPWHVDSSQGTSYPKPPHFHFCFSLAHKHTHLTHQLLITVLSSASSCSFLTFSLAHTHTHRLLSETLTMHLIQSLCTLISTWLSLSLSHTPCYVGSAHGASCPKPPHTQPPTAQRHNVIHTRHTPTAHHWHVTHTTHLSSNTHTTHSHKRQLKWQHYCPTHCCPTPTHTIKRTHTHPHAHTHAQTHARTHVRTHVCAHA